MYVVVCYDVVKNRIRARLIKALRGFLTHVQKSVFEGELADGRYHEMLERIRKEIDLEADTVRVYHLCARCRPATEIIGTGSHVEEERDEVL
ncbi:MAG: CRISPR-associated endonuclease Cas2 [Planctomycetes bacterium]|nr:CRISPR-associated endonuclease Cas2 [Planctomycetota bacterium]